MAENGIDLSVCTVAGQDDREALHRMLASLHDPAGMVECEALVAETGWQGLSALADEFSGLTVVRLGGLPPLAAINRLLGLSQGRYLLILPVGVILGPDCPRRLVDFMDEAPEVGLAGPRLVDPEGRELAFCAEFPWLLKLAGLPWPWPTPFLPGRTCAVDFCQGAGPLIRREAWDEIGPLRTGCWALAELDLYWRAKRRGWRNYHLQEARLIRTQPPARAARSFPAGLAALADFLACHWRG